MTTALVCLLLLLAVVYGTALHWRDRAERAESVVAGQSLALDFLRRANRDLASALVIERQVRAELESCIEVVGGPIGTLADDLEQAIIARSTSEQGGSHADTQSQTR